MHKLAVEFKSHFAYHDVMQVSTLFGRMETFRTHNKNRIGYEKCYVGRLGQSSLSVSNWLLSYCEYNADEHD